VLTVGGALDSPTAFLREPVEEPRPHRVERRDVAVVNQKRVLVAEGGCVFVARIADGGAADVGQQGIPFQTKGGLAVLFAARRGLHLPKAPGTAPIETPHFPSVRIRQAAGIATALVDERILGVEQFALGAGGVGGLEDVEAAHGFGVGVLWFRVLGC